MARPRLLNPKDGGEIVLRNCTPATYEAVRVALDNHAATVPVEVKAAAPEAAVAPPVPKNEMPFVAIGTFKCNNSPKYGLAVVSYNPDSRQAEVKEVELINEGFYGAVDSFKIAARKYKLV